MNADDVVGLLIPVTWLLMMGVEALAGGRLWPAQRLWRTQGVAFFVMLMTLNGVLPALLPESWRSHALLSAARWPLVLQVIAGYALLSLATALLHRAYHRYDLLWRWVHQLHHAPQRVDMASAVMFTPYEVMLNIAVFQAVVVFGLGLDPVAAAVVGYVSVFYGLFQHFNIRTPQWLGYLIQRPESHAVHHRRGLHGYNYADLPVWDLLWGTFRNPKEFRGEVGFEGQAPTRWAPLLHGRDANQPLYGAGSRGSARVQDNPA